MAVNGELKESMLISYDDLRKLCVILANFPNTVLSLKPNERLTRLKRRLLSDFDKTLCDELNPMPMSCDSMSFKLQPDAVPVCLTTGRRGNFLRQTPPPRPAHARLPPGE